MSAIRGASGARSTESRISRSAKRIRLTATLRAAGLAAGRTPRQASMCMAKTLSPIAISTVSRVAWNLGLISIAQGFSPAMKSTPTEPTQPLAAQIRSAHAIIAPASGWANGVTDPANPCALSPFPLRICRLTAMARARRPSATQETLEGIPSTRACTT